MSDPLSVSAIVISAVTAIGGVLTALHIRKMKSGCLDCDCTPSTPFARTPTISKSTIVLQPAPVNNISQSNNGSQISASQTNSEV